MSSFTVFLALLLLGLLCTVFGEWCSISGSLKQIDTGLTTLVWGVNSRDQIFRLNKDKSRQLIPGALKHVSAGGAGVWGVNSNNDIFYRLGVTASHPSGTAWRHIAGKLKQIDSGPSQIVYGVNKNDQIFCRTGIDSAKPFGTGWRRVDGSLKYVSCGALGRWGVNRMDNVFFRHGVRRQNCAGTRWSHIPGSLKQIEVGAIGHVYGINKQGQVFRRLGVTALQPLGTSWQLSFQYATHISTGWNGQYMLIDGAIYESSGCPRP